METIVISILSILATCGWWCIGVWGLTLPSGIFAIIFVLDGILTVFLLKNYAMNLSKNKGA